jgi:hypothetical protein
MRWNSVLAGLAVVLSATVATAETPYLGSESTTATSVLMRSRLMSGQTWWSRFGEPVNSGALASAEASPSDKGLYGAPLPVYGDGYAFGLGSCDCPPPCIWDLWAGYEQHPMRCYPYGHFRNHRCGRCGGCGGACGNGCCQSCTAKVPSCPAPVSCTAAVPGCGCKPVCGKCRHFHFGRWHGFAAHWTKSCDSCSKPLGCGCATPVGPPPGWEKQASGSPPKPLLGDALYPLPRVN